MIVEGIVIGGMCHQITCVFSQVCENPKVYPKVKLRRSAFPIIPILPIESGFPKIAKLQIIEHYLEVITNYVLSECNIFF